MKFSNITVPRLCLLSSVVSNLSEPCETIHSEGVFTPFTQIHQRYRSKLVSRKTIKRLNQYLVLTVLSREKKICKIIVFNAVCYFLCCLPSPFNPGSSSGGSRDSRVSISSQDSVYHSSDTDSEVSRLCTCIAY